MQLIKVYSNKESFQTVKFNKNGLSFIVARQKEPGTSENEKRIEIVNNLQNKLDKLMKYLGDHQALDVFVTLSDKSAAFGIWKLSRKRNQL